MSTGVEVRIPERDAPRPFGIALVFAASLATGIAIAWWGTREGERGEGDASGDVAGGGSLDAQGAESADAREGERGEGTERGVTDAGPSVSTGPSVSESTRPSASDGTSETTSTGERTSTDPGTRAGEGTSTDDGTGTGTRVSETTSAGESTGAPRASGSPSPGPLRLRRGRVAYLRCDGVEQGRRRTCPRDESLEAAAWAAIETLTQCSDPPREPGEADLRLEFLGAAPPDVAWRDTFPSSTVRLDRARVLACLTPALRRTRQSLGAERLLVSFRFALGTGL